MDSVQAMTVVEEFRVQVEDYLVSQSAEGVDDPKISSKDLHEILSDILEAALVAQETAQSSRATPGEMSRAASTRAAEFGSDDRRSEERKSSRTGKGRSGFMAIKTEPLSPTVPLVLEEVDIFQHEDVFGVLDDGANSSVCGKKWCDNAEKKLAGIGFEFPWLSKNGVSFKGLGGSTKTLGDRRLVFCVECRDPSSATRYSGLPRHFERRYPFAPIIVRPKHPRASEGFEELRMCCAEK